MLAAAAPRGTSQGASLGAVLMNSSFQAAGVMEPDAAVVPPRYHFWSKSFATSFAASSGAASGAARAGLVVAPDDGKPSEAKPAGAAQELAGGLSTQESSDAVAVAKANGGVDEMEVDDDGGGSAGAASSPTQSLAQVIPMNTVGLRADEIGDRDSKKDGPDDKPEMPPLKPQKRQVLALEERKNH